MPLFKEGISADLAERVLIRLGFAAPPPPDLSGLEAIYATWCRKIPFDNIRKRLHLAAGNSRPMPGNDDADFFEGWLRFGTGGTCWAGNGALCALLTSVGFSCGRGVTTMLISPNEPPNHGTVIVQIDSDRYLVDASILHGTPLRLDLRPPAGIRHPAWGIDYAVANDIPFIRWRPIHMPEGCDCRIDQMASSAGTFARLNEETRVWSPFNYELYARLNTADSVIGIAFGKKILIDESGMFHAAPIDRASALDFLIEKMGIHEEILRDFPKDGRTPPSPFH